ncbi:MAG TPA: chemotaxis protein CheB, partial [Caldilineaceae bacterium]|nr:chemotaxis protein CheB [Caldilineaceae bacterium]
MSEPEPQSEQPTSAGADQTSQERDTETSPIPRLSVIGIGASAGGLAALRILFSALPADTGMTFVVIMHLSPEHESALPTLLQPHT